MSSKSKLTKAASLAQVQALIAGTQTRFPNGTFMLGNSTFTAATLVQLFESLAAATTEANAAETAAKDAVAAMRATQAKVAPVVRDFRRFVLTSFGTTAEPLADFGLPPPKARATRTVEQTAAAAAKLRATRESRGTTSTKQKLALKGKVTGVTITPGRRRASRVFFFASRVRDRVSPPHPLLSTTIAPRCPAYAPNHGSILRRWTLPVCVRGIGSAP